MQSIVIVYLLLSLYVVCFVSELTVLKVVQTIYDRSPKLRIRGSGFDADYNDIVLELGVSGAPHLSTDVDYKVVKDGDGDGLILRLLNDKR